MYSYTCNVGRMDERDVQYLNALKPWPVAADQAWIILGFIFSFVKLNQILKKNYVSVDSIGPKYNLQAKYSQIR